MCKAQTMKKRKATRLIFRCPVSIGDADQDCCCSIIAFSNGCNVNRYSYDKRDLANCKLLYRTLDKWIKGGNKAVFGFGDADAMLSNGYSDNSIE